MHLARLEIDGLRAIEELRLSFETANGEPRRRIVLLGANGSGKTTILDAIAHAIQALGPAELGAPSLSAGDVAISREVRADMLAASESRPEGAERDRATTSRAPRASITLHGALADEEHEAIRPFFPGVADRGVIGLSVPEASQITSPDGGGAPFANAAGVLFRHFPTPPAVLLRADRGGLAQRDTLVSDIRRFDARRAALARGRDRFSPLAPRLSLAAASPRFDPHGVVNRMWKVLAKYFPELPRPVERGSDLGLWFVTRRGSTVPLSRLSDGERAVLLIFGELALRNPRFGLVLIDEVEQHLHPRWQRAILEALTSLLPAAQFIITTQSPYLASVAPDDVIKVGDWDGHGE